jgi:hypothetical protein
VELHIGTDTDKTIVSPYAVKPRTGRVSRRTTGSVTEYVPREPTGRTRESRVATAARLALPLMLLTAVLYALGVPWLLPAAASAALVGTVWHRQSRAAARGTFAIPAGDDVTVLRTPEERAAYRQALGISRRVRRTWPVLPDMIDPITADRALTHALADLAVLLGRRQELRRLRAELSAVRPGEVPADSPAMLALSAQAQRVAQLWNETGGQADRILHSLEAAARAGETFAREQCIGETARAARDVLATLSAGAPPADAGPELAARTDAVITAYRELAVIGID